MYYAWVLYGATAFQVGFYHLQRYYFSNWYTDTTYTYGSNGKGEYKSTKPNLYTYFGMAETVNRVASLIMWTITCVGWMLTLISYEGFTWFFTHWARVLHYFDMIRLLVVTVMKMVGFFIDVKTDYGIDDGTNGMGTPSVPVTME